MGSVIRYTCTCENYPTAALQHLPVSVNVVLWRLKANQRSSTRWALGERTGNSSTQRINVTGPACYSGVLRAITFFHGRNVTKCLPVIRTRRHLEGFLATPLKLNRVSQRNPRDRAHNQSNFCLSLGPSLPACPALHLQLSALALLAQSLHLWLAGHRQSSWLLQKLIISISMYCISFIYFNHSLWEAPTFPHEWSLLERAEMSERAVFSWHMGRDLHTTTIFNDCAGVQVSRAHLRGAACPFDVWILQMKSRGETEMNHGAVLEMV